MNEHIPHPTATISCPVLHKPCAVSFEVNVFRSIEHGGLVVTACSEFPNQETVPTCWQECVFAQEAQDIYRDEIRKHQAELALIGSSVIG